MDAKKIKLMMDPSIIYDRSNYADTVVSILKAPKLYHPIQRYKYFKNFDRLVYAVMAEYASELLSELS
jgi:hypothetical protein